MLSNDLSVQLYQSINDEHRERQYDHWHASSIAACPRAHYFYRLGVEQLRKPSAAKMIRWGAGHLLEETIRPHIASIYSDVISNGRITSETLGLSGEFDNYSLRDKTLIEIKSVDDWAFLERDGVTSLKEATGNKNKWGRDEYGPKDEPYIHHQLQNHCYALLLKERGIEVESIDYIYIALKGRVVAYKTKLNPKYLAWVEKRLELLNNAWQKQEPPECICSPDHALWGAVLQWCDYFTETECCSLELIKEKERIAS